MFFFKSCPRCKGDLYLDRDNYGKFLTCMQCGYQKEPLPNTENEDIVLRERRNLHSFTQEQRKEVFDKQAENNLRIKKYCMNGHEYLEDNIFYAIQSYNKITRVCKQCREIKLHGS